MKKYHIVYKTTNIINEKFYIGVHSQNVNPDQEDGYLGSGKLLQRAIKKYGKEHFKRITLKSFKNKKDAYSLERKIVNYNFLKSGNNYNLGIGGYGGDNISMKSPEEKARISELMVKNKTYVTTDIHRKNSSIGAKLRIQKYPETLPKNKGRKHYGVALINIRKAATNRVGNWIFITDGVDEKYQNIIDNIPKGWSRGRSNKMIEMFKNYKHSDEIKQKISNHKNIKGIVNWTNGTKNIKLQKNEMPPKDYYKGMTVKIIPNYWVNDGDVEKRIEKSISIPTGWRLGRLARIWITNGIISKKILKNESIYEGWKRGRK